MASIVLASSVLAQENPPTSIPKIDIPELSGLISPLGGKFYPGAFVKEEDRNTPGIKLLPQGKMPEGAQLVGDISGPFANAQTGRIEIGKVTLNDVSDKCLIRGATYHAELVLVSKQGIYGVALQHPDQKKAALSVELSVPAKSIHISSDIEASSLWGQKAEWSVATVVPPLAPIK